MTDGGSGSGAAAARPPRSLSYSQVRTLMLVGGLALLAVTAAVNYVRRVETAEVAAILFFIPIFVAFVFWDWKGGLVAAVLATIGYIALRQPAIHAIGAGRFTSLIFSRSVAFFAFGAIGGLANQQLRSSLTKLDLYDQIDDETGLFNARYFLQDTDLEMSRARRYQTLFSVSAVDFPASAIDDLGWRRRRSTLSQLGELLAESVRTVDRAVHAHDGDRHRLVVVLPETATEGAQVFTDRLATRVAAFLAQRGGKVDEADVSRRALTFPGDEAGLQQLREQFADIERREHPEHPEEALVGGTGGPDRRRA
ncbi:MAG: diguanylate cyclase [Acidimicrobiia bacterium]|nr:diguanylate cyclase [Acidimicrobiia bacterium]